MKYEIEKILGWRGEGGARVRPPKSTTEKIDCLSCTLWSVMNEGKSENNKINVFYCDW